MPRPDCLRPATELLVRFARLHRDQRNITTHLAGVPMVVFAAALLLARVPVAAGVVNTTLAWPAFAALALWVLSRGQWLVGLATTAATAVLVFAAHQFAGFAPALAATLGVALLVLGWLAQAIGHYYEGRRPVVGNDLGGVLVAPMFVALTFLAMAGLCRPLMARIEQAAGPTTLRDLAQPLAR